MYPHNEYPPWWYFNPPQTGRTRRRTSCPDPFRELERLDKYREKLKEEIAKKEKEEKDKQKKPPSQIEQCMGLLHWFALFVTFGYPLGHLWWHHVLKPALTMTP